MLINLPVLHFNLFTSKFWRMRVSLQLFCLILHSLFVLYQWLLARSNVDNLFCYGCWLPHDHYKGPPRVTTEGIGALHLWFCFMFPRSAIPKKLQRLPALNSDHWRKSATLCRWSYYRFCPLFMPKVVVFPVTHQITMWFLASWMPTDVTVWLTGLISWLAAIIFEIISNSVSSKSNLFLLYGFYYSRNASFGLARVFYRQMWPWCASETLIIYPLKWFA